jgi:CheY-like chemotaxis protein
MKVLLIDDNYEITGMISFFLESNNISCKIANDGKEGLERIKNEKYDVILLDLTMPQFSGFDIFDYLKQNDLLKTNNVLLFTSSNTSKENIQEMVKEGAKGILIKPISIDLIIEAIEKFK